MILTFFHENIIRLCNRPFKDVAEMNSAIINNWNRVVTQKDTVYILGDVAMGKATSDDVCNILRQLKGKKVLITGNHDKLKNDSKFHNCFEYVKNYDEITDGNRRVILFHYPIEDWNGKFRGSYHLYGHIHNNANAVGGHILNRFNVGVEAIDYTPITLNTLIAIQNDSNSHLKW